ncbi:excisionase family DNA-binding protein [soil metagenome]
MVVTEPLLKTRQVAQALGMSVSTIKRWVDSGSLRATRTVGRHRLIPVSEALRFARENQLPSADLELLAGLGTGRVETNDDRTLEALLTALRRGRTREASDLLRSAYACGAGAIELADSLIRPAMERIGHDWEAGKLDVYQEHRASRIVESALMDLIRRSPISPEGAPLALGATPEGDLYTIPGLLCELTLREQGWEVVNLGPNLPMVSLASAVLAQQPRLVWLSVHHLQDTDRFLQEYSIFHAKASRTGAAVVLGGPVLGPDLRARMVAASFGDRMAHFGEFARRLHPTPTHSPKDGLSDRQRPGSTTT